MIKESFTVCGVKKHDRSPTGEWIIQRTLLHSVLRCLIESAGQISTYVDTDIELEASDGMMMEMRENEDEIEDGSEEEPAQDEDLQTQEEDMQGDELMHDDCSRRRFADSGRRYAG